MRLLARSLSERSVPQGELPFPLDAIGAAMGRGAQFNGVARFEPRFAEVGDGQVRAPHESIANWTAAVEDQPQKCSTPTEA
jgi:hypothetical protein